jgi:hypothetical protein
MSELDELKDELESLRGRVRRLEQQVEEHDETYSGGSQSALDSRDRAVLDAVSERGDDPGPRATVGLYTRLTDITNRDTAVTRAKRLRQMDAFDEVVRE